MEADFMNDLADFLEERLSKALFALREKSEEYRILSDEYESLLSINTEDIEAYRQAIIKISDISKKLSYCEKHYLFLAGIQEHFLFKEVLLSEVFEKNFFEVE